MKEFELGREGDRYEETGGRNVACICIVRCICWKMLSHTQTQTPENILAILYTLTTAKTMCSNLNL